MLAPTMCGVTARADRVARVSLLIALLWLGTFGAAHAQETVTSGTAQATAPHAMPATATPADERIDEEAIAVADERLALPPEVDPQQGRVIAVEKFAAVVEFPDPVLVGEHVAIRVRVEDQCPYRVSVLNDDCRVVARVISIEGNRARVSLGLNEVVEVGALVYQVIERRTASRVAPPRRGGFFELGASATLGGTLKVAGIFGYGTMFATYRGRRPVFARIELDPTGAIASSSGDGFVAGFVAFAGLDSRLFELGMGLGVAHAYTWASPPTPKVGAALAMPVVMRFGALDGIYVRIRVDFFARDGRTETGGGSLVLQVPTRLGAWIVASVGASLNGVYGVNVGYRRLVIGDNGPGSVYFVFGGGVQGMLSKSTFNRESYFQSTQVGLAGTIGVEARVGRR